MKKGVILQQIGKIDNLENKTSEKIIDCSIIANKFFEIKLKFGPSSLHRTPYWLYLWIFQLLTKIFTFKFTTSDHKQKEKPTP